VATEFVCQFGNDAHAARLERTLTASGLELSGCGRSADSATGQGLVFLQGDGSVSAVVVGGANEAGWTDDFAASLGSRLAGAAALLLQREIPEAVNARLIAEASDAGVTILLDIGGADRPLADELLKRVSPPRSNIQLTRALTLRIGRWPTSCLNA
jgi:ribokinase